MVDYVTLRETVERLREKADSIGTWADDFDLSEIPVDQADDIAGELIEVRSLIQWLYHRADRIDGIVKSLL